MVIATLGHIGYRHGRMWLDPDNECDHATAGMEEFLGERRLTVGVVTSILDVVTAG